MKMGGGATKELYRDVFLFVICTFPYLVWEFLLHYIGFSFI